MMERIDQLIIPLVADIWCIIAPLWEIARIIRSPHRGNPPTPRRGQNADWKAVSQSGPPTWIDGETQAAHGSSRWLIIGRVWWRCTGTAHSKWCLLQCLLAHPPLVLRAYVVPIAGKRVGEAKTRLKRAKKRWWEKRTRSTESKA